MDLPTASSDTWNTPQSFVTLVRTVIEAVARELLAREFLSGAEVALLSAGVDEPLPER